MFIDEIDKIVDGGGGRMVGGSVSSDGVQRDLLPIIEGGCMGCMKECLNASLFSREQVTGTNSSLRAENLSLMFKVIEGSCQGDAVTCIYASGWTDAW